MCVCVCAHSCCLHACVQLWLRIVYAAAILLASLTFFEPPSAPSYQPWTLGVEFLCIAVRLCICMCVHVYVHASAWTCASTCVCLCLSSCISNRLAVWLQIYTVDIVLKMYYMGASTYLEKNWHKCVHCNLRGCTSTHTHTHTHTLTHSLTHTLTHSLTLTSKQWRPLLIVRATGCKSLSWCCSCWMPLCLRAPEQHSASAASFALRFLLGAIASCDAHTSSSAPCSTGC